MRWGGLLLAVALGPGCLWLTDAEPCSFPADCPAARPVCDAKAGICVATASPGDGGQPREDGGPRRDGGGPDAGDVDAGDIDAGDIDAGDIDAGGFFCAPDADDCPAEIDLGAAIASRPGVLFDFAPTPLAGGQNELGDVIGWPRGQPLGTAFHERADSGQGTIAAWITTGWDLGSLPAGQSYTLLEVADLDVELEPSEGRIVVDPGNAPSVAFSLADFPPLAAGAPLFLAVRWDSRHPLDGTNHVLLTVNDVTLGGLTAGWTASAPTGLQVLGAANGAGRRGTAARIEGFTLWRRPLKGGVGGVDVGAGDEIGALYAAGAGRDPSHVTGSWDVVFSLPGDQRAGPLSPGGQAFSHPHATGLLADRGFFLGATPAEGWTADEAPGGPVTLAAMPPEHTLFGGGLAVTSGAEGGAYAEVSAGTAPSLVVRALAHSDGTSVPDLLVSDCALSPLAQATGTATSTRRAPDVLVVTVSPPATCVRVALRNAASASTVYWHQVEALPNLVANASLEAGGDVSHGANGTLFVPTGWGADTGVPAGATALETDSVHSGEGALRIDVDTGSAAHLWFEPAPLVEGRFYAVGGFFSWRAGGAPAIHVAGGNLFSPLRAPGSPGAKLRREGEAAGAAFQHLVAVGRRVGGGQHDNHDDIVRFGALAGPAEVIVDDTYLIALEPVALTLLPADRAGSTHENRLLVDGADLAVQRDPEERFQSGLEVRLRLGPPLGAPLATCEAPFLVLDLVGEHADEDWARLVAGGDGMFLVGMADGALFEGPLGPALSLGVPYTLELRREGATWELLVDGASRGVVTAPDAWGSDLDSLVFGSSAAGAERCDLEVQLPGARLY